MSICVYLWAHLLLAKVRGRIEQEVAEQTETVVKSPLLPPFPPVGSFLLSVHLTRMDVRGQMLR